MKLKVNKKISVLLLFLIIICQLIYTTYVFVEKKEGVHSDEIWSYGLANSYYKPFVYLKKDIHIDDQKDEYLDNCNKWISGSVLKDYITVQEGERFSYKSVYYNQTLDHHPPLYYFLLHTISSFFPNKFSFWYGYFLSCIFLVITQIFLYKLALLVTKGNKPCMALMVCLLYAAGLGSVSTFIFIRMYSLVTAITVIHIYFQFKLYYSEDFNIKKCILPVIITGLLGLLSHNMFAVIMGTCTACICIWLLFRKKIKKMFIYGFSMLGTLGIFFIIYPSTLTQIFKFNSVKSKAAMASIVQFKKFLTYVTGQNLGFTVSIYKSPVASYLIAALVIIVVLSVPLCFLFRNETWFIKFRENLITKVKSFKSTPCSYFSKVNYPVIFLIVVILVYSFVTAKTVDLIGMGNFSARYVMPMYPLASLLGVTIIQYIVSWIPKIKKVTPIVSLAAVLFIIFRINFYYENFFLFKQPNNYKDFSKTLANQKCEVVLDSPWLMTCYQHLLMNCSEVKFSISKQFYNKNNINFDELKKGETRYIILGTTDLSNLEKSSNKSDSFTIQAEGSVENIKKHLDEKETIEKIKQQPNVDKVEFQYHANIQGGTVSLYKIN